MAWLFINRKYKVIYYYRNITYYMISIKNLDNYILNLLYFFTSQIVIERVSSHEGNFTNCIEYKFNTNSRNGTASRTFTATELDVSSIIIQNLLTYLMFYIMLMSGTKFGVVIAIRQKLLQII